MGKDHHDPSKDPHHHAKDKDHGVVGHNEHHHEHHHDHHEHESESQKHYLDQQLEKVQKGSPLDFTHKHPVFNIQLNKVGPEFSSIDDLRAEYIKKVVADLKMSDVRIKVPANIPGLVMRKGDLPRNRRFWTRPTSSFERNGTFNLHTPNFGTRVTYPFFFLFLLYGWWGHATYGWYKAKYEDNDQILGNVYDKCNTRSPPMMKIWLRPG